MINPQELPPEARSLIAKIEAHLREAQPLLQTSTQTADVFALRETQQRYLLETIQVFLAVPLSLRQTANERGESATTQLLKSLTILESATLAHLQNLAATQRDAAEINQQFLAERFAGIAPADAPASEPLAADFDMPTVPSTMLIQSIFTQASREAGGNEQRLLEAIAAKFTDAFPRLTRVERPLFSKNIKRLEVSVPTAEGAVRYILRATSYGFEADLVTVVRGIALKTQTVSSDQWTAQLIEHLAVFTNTNKESEARLRELFER